jgi:hypothetical protein
MRVVDESAEGTRRKPSGLIQIAPTGARWKMVVNLTGKQHADDDDDDNAAKDPDHGIFSCPHWRISALRNQI